MTPEPEPRPDSPRRSEPDAPAELDEGRATPAPITGRRARPLTRGLGVLVGVMTFGFVGLIDGVIALIRAPRGSLGPQSSVFVLFHAAAVLVTFGIVLGALEDLLLESARRVPTFARASAWLIEGPRRWFARDERLALRALCALLGLAILIGPVFPAAYFATTSFKSQLLAATAITLVVIASAASAALAVVVLAAPLGALMRRLGPLASPGAIVALAALAALIPLARFVQQHWSVFQNIDYGPAAIALALLAGNAIALLALGARAARAGRPPGLRVVLSAAAIAVLAFLVSAATFGRRQTVVAAIFNRSVVSQYVVRLLSAAIDLDRDGYSPAFGGGDCDDSNPRINPGAPDLPGNGIDENCSGMDARPLAEEAPAPPPPLPPALAVKPSVVFVVIDALRPDHLGCYGYPRPTSPNIDAFAAGAARFTNAYAVAPRTLLSLSSIWVGRYPSLIAWGRDVRYPPLEEQNATLAELLGAAGYHTAAFNNIDFFSRTQGFYQGFAEVRQGRHLQDESGPAVEQLLEYLDGRAEDPQPFFAWLHILEAHAPYYDRDKPKDFGHQVIDRYDEGIAHADELLGPLFAKLDALAARRSIVTVVTADHGEAFGEHGAHYHGYDLHDEALRVPLLVRGPGIAPGPREPLTALIDLHPTIVQLGGGAASADGSGRSLVPVLADPSPRSVVFPGWRDHLYAEATPDGFIPAEQKTLYAPPYKLLHDYRTGAWELFDIARDRGETVNLFDDRPAEASALREQLLAWADAGALAANRSTAIIAQGRLSAEPSPQHPVHVKFGDVVELIGYDLPSARIPLRGTLRATFYYRVLRRTRTPKWLNVRFEPLDGRGGTDFNARHYPLFGRYPTTQWTAGEILRDEVELRVEPDVRPTRMRMELVIEREPNLQAIPPARGANADGGLDLGEIEIVPAP